VRILGSIVSSLQIAHPIQEGLAFRSKGSIGVVGWRGERA
jgi:hypothetical protein